jgi:hypothetical protein
MGAEELLGDEVEIAWSVKGGSDRNRRVQATTPLRTAKQKGA